MAITVTASCLDDLKAQVARLFDRPLPANDKCEPKRLVLTPDGIGDSRFVFEGELDNFDANVYRAVKPGWVEFGAFVPPDSASGETKVVRIQLTNNLIPEMPVIDGSQGQRIRITVEVL